jgi:hypothetical protein
LCAFSEKKKEGPRRIKKLQKKKKKKEKESNRNKKNPNQNARESHVVCAFPNSKHWTLGHVRERREVFLDAV